jgi:hypothetical protein
MNVEFETLHHIREVNKEINTIVTQLLLRADKHDASKFSDEELQTFLKYTPLLHKTTYGSNEYRRYLIEMQPALNHHYKINSHHPEHFVDGIKGMNLFDILEMFCDWKAATKRHSDGNIIKSIEQNQKRFGYSDELKQILLNTVYTLDKGLEIISKK